MTLRPLARGLVFLVACVALPALAAGPSADTSFGVESVSFADRGAFVKVDLQGCTSMSTVGSPELPIKLLHFVIPADMSVRDVVITELEESALPGKHTIMPAQREVPIGETPEWVGPDASVYGSDDRYPPRRVEYLGDGYLGGFRIATVAVYPLQYQPASGRLTLATRLSVGLSLAPDGKRTLPRHRVTSRTAGVYKDAVRALVENPKEVDGRFSAEAIQDVSDGGFLPRYTPSLEGSPVDYVIITTEDFVPYFQVLADWKTKKGVPTVIKTVSWIDANYPGGCDTQERIRFFIADAYESWGTSFVLLGGDTDSVPARYGYSSYYGGNELACDLYYSDLDSNWNLDGDSSFGEGYAGAASPGDSLDLYPDVFVGRAPVETEIEAETFVTKTLAYEKYPDPVFAERRLFMAEVLFPYDWVPGEQWSTDGATDVVEPMLPILPAEVHKTLLYQRTEVNPESYPLSAPAALDSMDMGYNITTHVGHGSKDIIRCSNNSYITFADIDGLANGTAKLWFMWMLNCTTNQIQNDCVGEHFMNNPDGGAAYVFGPSHFCYPTTAKDYLKTWNELLYDGVDRTGVVSSMCKTPYVNLSNYDNTNRWTQMTFLLLGDPESRLWTRRPTSLSVIHDSNVPLGPSNLSITVIDPAPVDSALVCVAKNGEVYATGYTNASGQVLLPFTPRTTGTMTITVTARNHFPYEDVIGVTPAAGAHLTLREMDVDDDAFGGSDGNANGRAEAGETIQLDMRVGNGGTATASSVTATLSTSDPYVTMVDSTESLGSINAGAQPLFDAAFSMELSIDCPNDHDVPLTVQYSTASRTTWTSSYMLRVVRPILVQSRDTYNDGNDGIPSVGETVTWTIDILNDGNGDADGVTGVLRYPFPEATVTDSTDAWGDIVAGGFAAGQNGFVVTLNDSLAHRFQLTLTDEDGKTWVLPFDVEMPSVPQGLDGRVKATTVYLMWNPTEDADLLGYNVYRADQPTSPFVKTNDRVVAGSAYYEDAGLAEEHIYFYRVAAVDSSGNESALSETLEITTNPPSQSGWPLKGGEAMYSSPALADVDLDGDLEVLVGSGEIYGWHHTGIEITDGDGDPRSEGVLADDGTGGYRSSVAIGQLDDDPNPEIVAAAWGDVGTVEDPTYEVWAWNAEDGTVLPGWPVYTGKFCWATPTLADLNKDGLDEVILPCADGFLYVWKPDGSELIDGDSNPSTEGVFSSMEYSWGYGSAAVVDIDNDHDLEILVPSRSKKVYCLNPDGSSVAGWPVDLGGSSRGSVAVGDVNHNGQIEVVATTNAGKVHLLSAQGLEFPNWPKSVVFTGDFPSSPTLADLDGDGDLEIMIVSSEGTVHVWRWEGTVFPGWPQTIDNGVAFDVQSSITVGDVDGDAGLELVTGSGSGKVYAFNSNGTLVAGWPIQTDGEVVASAAIADLDGDGDVEVVMSGKDQRVYIWDTVGSEPEDGTWSAFRQNSRRNGYQGYELEVGVPEDGTDGVVSMVRLDQNVPNPFNPVTTIGYTVPDGGREIDLSIYNVAGVRVTTLFNGKAPAGRASVVWNGTDADGRRVASGVYFVRLTARDATLARKIVLLK